MSKMSQAIMLLCSGVTGVLLGSSVAAGGGSVVVVSACRSDADCDDGVFCDGQERCLHSSGGATNGLTGANARGCLPAAGSPCAGTGLACSEASRRCMVLPVDADGDGHPSIATGGDDCDDGDANRYPGNHEVCDPANRDEDCDPSTFGVKDDDSDGQVDARCCNFDAAGAQYCGTDMDDTRFEIRRGSQVCDGANVYSGDLGQMQPCPTGTVCIVQPNLAGVCGVAPAGYVAPPRYTGPVQPPVVARVIKPRSGPNPILPAVLRPRPFPR